MGIIQWSFACADHPYHLQEEDNTIVKHQPPVSHTTSEYCSQKANRNEERAKKKCRHSHFWLAFSAILRCQLEVTQLNVRSASIAKE
jgi:hypothetical protein